MPRFDDLGLPPGVERLAEEHRGLVLVTGATGSGKTTTLAAMIDHINRTRRSHIVTIEDPIEILHPDHLSIVNQREVGLDTESFGQALRRALRQDPDTILIGELRDAETAQTALQAAESGHLVFSTLHTIDAAETIGRMIEFFPEGKQQQIRSIMAGVLRGVISQRLLPRVGGGRVAAVEVMVNNARIADLIREDKPDEITDAIAEGEFFEMQTFQQALIEKVLDGHDRPRGRRERLDATGTTSWSRSSTPRRRRPPGIDHNASAAAVVEDRGRAGARARARVRAPPRAAGRLMKRLLAGRARRAGGCDRQPRRARPTSGRLRPTARGSKLGAAERRRAERSDGAASRSCSCAPAQPQQLTYEQLLPIWQAAAQAYGVPW